jgi:hypothetical protein
MVVGTIVREANGRLARWRLQSDCMAPPVNKSVAFEFAASVRNSARQACRRALRAMGRPVLPYVEVHLTDHCNLNCRACGHYSPLAVERYADLAKFGDDLRRLIELFYRIEVLRLMGGEPLLHPQISEALGIARARLPKTDIRLVTNGVLLSRMDANFWRICSSNRIRIDVTRYPIALDYEQCRALAAAMEVAIDISEQRTEFLAFMNLRGNSDPAAAWNACRTFANCPFLQDGVLYSCSMSATVAYFNAAFGASVPARGGISIHDSAITADRILAELDRPVAACRYCATEYRKFPWAISAKKVDEWDASSV